MTLLACHSPLIPHMCCLQLAHSATVPMPQPQQTRPFAIPHNRPPASRGREALSQAQASPLRSPAHAASPAVCFTLIWNLPKPEWGLIARH